MPKRTRAHTTQPERAPHCTCLLPVATTDLDGDIRCLRCGRDIPGPEMRHLDDTASIDSWGSADLGGQAA